MPNPLNESSPKSTLSSRSLTPEILAKSNCSQCHLLRAKIQSMDQSSICSTSSQGSYSRSQTPDSVNCPDHRSTPNTPHHNHLINHKLFSRDSPPSQWLYRRRDRRTGQVMLPNIVPTTDYSSFTRSSRKKKSLVHPGEYSFEKDFDSTIETQIDDLDTSNLAHNDQSTKEENESSLIEKQLTAIEMRLNNHHMTRKMMTLLKNPAFLLSFYFIECFTISLLWFNRIQPEKFIDEQFHHGQTVSYCQGNFTKWDRKITTPPGLYLISMMILKPVDLLLSTNTNGFCQSLATLRFINTLFSLGNFILFHKIFNQNLSRLIERNVVIVTKLSALIAIHLSPMFLFTFLYYTDTGSIFFTLLMYYYHQNRKHNWASLIGFISLWFRQTNIIWIFFLASITAINIFANSYSQYYDYKKLTFEFGSIKMRFRLYQHQLSNHYYLFCFLLDWIFQIFRHCFGYILNGFAFLTFVYLNQGIVLGDRSAHQAVLHLAQIPYFLTFVFLFAWPWILSGHNLQRISRQFISKPSWFLLLAILLANCLSPPFTYEHSYLLADNRHYVFYIWKRFWYRTDLPWTRYLPLPFYLMTAVSMWNLLDLNCLNWPSSSSCLQDSKKSIQNSFEIVKKITFFILVTLVIIPQRLIEFRYFIAPYLFWRLHIIDREHSMIIRLLLEFIWIIFLNLTTFLIFNFKTFRYGEENLIQRIIW